MTRLRFVARIVTVGVWLVFASCSRNDAPPTPRPAPSSSAQLRTRAADRLDPDELPEGRERAFALHLPRGMRVRSRGPMQVVAEADLSPEKVANYLRKRLQSDGVEVGAARTVFERARIVGDPQPNRLVRVEVLRTAQTTRVVVVDLTPRKVDRTRTPEQTWQRHGFDKDGKLLDPKALE